MSGRPITEDDFHALVDGALEAGRQREVETYLEGHADVARRIDGYRQQRDALRKALLPIAQEPVPSDLDLARMVARRGRGTAPWWQAIAAAVVLFAMGGATGWWLRPPASSAANGIAGLAEEASTTYAVFAPDRLHPVEIRASDGALLTEWIASRLGRAIALPDLSSAGFRLMGGRIVATPHGPAGMLMYDDDLGTRIAMLVRPMDQDKEASMVERRNGSVDGFAWADRGLGYSLVGSAPPARLHPLADEIRRQVARKA